MLTIYRTNLSSDYPRALEESIVRRVGLGEKTYLIVPEQDTVMREVRMTSLLPDNAPLCFEVTNFSRFANSAFRALGGISGEYCDDSKKALIMWRALTELSPMLTMTKAQGEIGQKLAETSLLAVKEMQSFGISAEELYAVTEADGVRDDARLQSKLRDLATVYSLYKRMLAEKFADSGDDTEMVIRRLGENSTFLSGYEIYIDGFTSFTEPQYRLIAELSNRCNISLYLPYPKGSEELFEYTEPRESIEKLKKACRMLGVSISIKHALDYQDKQSTSIYEICAHLWNKNSNIDYISLQNDEEVRIFEASTPFEMCDFVAQDIRRRVIEGSAYSDFAVIARDANIYKGLIDRSMRAADIPTFFSSERDPSAFEAIKLIYTAYSIIRSGFAQEDVITYSKCGLCGIERIESDELEAYVNAWSITGSRFTDGNLWNMNPLGYTLRRPDGTDEKLQRINATRDRLIAPLMKFRENTLAAKTVRESAVALYGFLTELKLEEQLKARAERLIQLGENDFAEDNLRLWQLICDTLDTLVEVNGDCPSDSESFLGQFKLLISSAKIGKIPSYIDSVTVGRADMIRLRGKKHVYLIGVNAGEFPSAPSDSSFFSERDKLSLSAAGLKVEPNMEIRNARELFILSRAMCYAAETVTLLYSRTNTKFKATEPSSVPERIRELCGVIPMQISSLPLKDRLWSAEAALTDTTPETSYAASAVRDALCRSGYESTVRISEGSIENSGIRLGEDICRGLYSKPLPLTQTQLESFVGCPLSYFCRFTVKLGEDEVHEMDSRGIGTFIHAILENFFTYLNEKNISAGDLTEEERISICEESARKYIGAMEDGLAGASAMTAVKIARLRRASVPIINGLCEEFSVSKFKPRLFEIRITKGSPDSPAPLTLTTDKNREVYVYGVIDRVDTYEKDGRLYVRVVDYKTGKKDFSPDDVKDGKNLQMFLYLKSILETDNKSFRHRLGAADGEEILPAGVLYVRTSVGDVRIDRPDDALAEDAIRDEQKREGMVLYDEDVIGAMGLRYTPLYSKRSPDKIPNSKRELLFTSESYSELMSTVEESVKAIADRIIDGEADASPGRESGSATHCEYCKFKPICRKSSYK